MREKKPIVSFRGHGDLSYCIKRGRMSGMLVSGETFSITKVLSDDVDDFQDPTYIHIIHGSPSGCVGREIPGVTQVDEKGHEGNTAVVTAYVCWRKHGIYLS